MSDQQDDAEWNLGLDGDQTAIDGIADISDAEFDTLLTLADQLASRMFLEIAVETVVNTIRGAHERYLVADAACTLEPNTVAEDPDMATPHYVEFWDQFRSIVGRFSAHLLTDLMLGHYTYDEAHVRVFELYKRRFGLL